jgi:hypothetical protein
LLSQLSSSFWVPFQLFSLIALYHLTCLLLDLYLPLFV